jgi:NDP-sugar pyrophosphorylase family protein
MKPTLVILAAGMASRYGRMKQTEGFGPAGETIMDYSIYDALQSGFGRIIFIIRKEFHALFSEMIDAKLKGKIEVDYVFQEMNSFTGNYQAPAERTKPWGTAHALLCTKHSVKEPFAIINADDFYGRDAFQQAARFLGSGCNEKTYAIIGYHLNKTLSEFGSVSRGVCNVDPDGSLGAINERTRIYRKEGSIVYEDKEGIHPLKNDTIVSMNFFCFHPSVFDLAEKLFHSFLQERGQDPKAEFFIPLVADAFIRQPGNNILVIPTASSWFGVTYPEDAPFVKNSLQKLVDEKIYPPRLWK